MKRLIYTTIFMLIAWNSAMAAFQVKESGNPSSDFPLVGREGAACVLYDDNDFESVKTAIDLFVDDVYRVSGRRIKKNNDKSKGDRVVIIGTIGHNTLIDRLIEQGKLDVSSILGGWEQYAVKTMDNPVPGIGRTLVIAGIDRRGTAYGVMELSKAIGVNPLYWWSDVPVTKHKYLYLTPVDTVSAAPSVRYRGIFINDEGWGITPWAKNGLDADINDIGPNTYAKVCELLLRLKANMLAPAMHPSSGAFNKYPENARVADRYGIIMTSSHCEPLLFNNVTEWDSETMGDWNYITNREGIMKVLDDRIATNHPYENIYTIAMRGIHDAGLIGVPEDKEVELVESVIEDQRGILKKYIDSPVEDIPQIFVPYKEVLDIYEKGLRLPDDITLVWPDDNYGYIKRLNNSKERERSGGSGVYYHISYLGEPHDYLWLNTTPPALMMEEMGKAYGNGADRYWLLNVGDIKPGELGFSTFLDMAWDISRFNPENINTHQTDILCSAFGEKYRGKFQKILDKYYTLGFQHKPEAMGWGWEWNSKRAVEKVADTDFSVANYREVEKRLEAYRLIADMAQQVYDELPKEDKDAFFQLMYYPVKGAYYMNQKMLKAQLNRWHAAHGNRIADRFASETKEYSDSIDHITRIYNSLAKGKWSHMMSLAPGWVATYQLMPPLNSLAEPVDGVFEAVVHGSTRASANILPCQSPFFSNDRYIDIFNKGLTDIIWKAECTDPCVILSSDKGTLAVTDRIGISIDWNKVAEGRHTAVITISSDGNCKEEIIVPIYKPSSSESREMKGLFAENDGYVSISTACPHRVIDDKGSLTIRTLPGLGYEGASIQLGDANAPLPSCHDLEKACRAEYDFYTYDSGSVVVHAYALPVFPLTNSHRTRFGIMIDDGDVKYLSNDAKEYSGEWRDNVARNACIKSTTLRVDKPGKHTFKLICSDPGMVIQKVVIDFGGLKPSYLGPEPTLVL